jgi:uncharacterized protein (DUF952 family)
MTSFFRIISTVQWDEAQITGFIPRNSEDQATDSVRVYQFKDLESVCNQSFSKEDVPVALEFAPESYPDLLQWNEPILERPWREGHLKIEYLMADLVLNIYSFSYQQAENGLTCKIQGEI